MANVKTEADTHDDFSVKYLVEAKVNFKENDQIWYRDSQLFDGAQVNEFSTEINQWDGEGDEPDNFIIWKGEDQVQIGVTGIGLKESLSMVKCDLNCLLLLSQFDTLALSACVSRLNLKSYFERSF